MSIEKFKKIQLRNAFNSVLNKKGTAEQNSEISFVCYMLCFIQGSEELPMAVYSAIGIPFKPDRDLQHITGHWLLSQTQCFAYPILYLGPVWEEPNFMWIAYNGGLCTYIPLLLAP